MGAVSSSLAPDGIVAEGIAETLLIFAPQIVLVTALDDSRLHSAANARSRG